MKKWTIKKRLAVGFGAVICLLLVIAGLSITVVSKSKAAAEGIAANDVPGLVFSGKAAAIAQEQVGLLFHHIASDDPAMLATIEVG